MHGGGACVAGGRAWQGMCVVRACVVGSVHGGGVRGGDMCDWGLHGGGGGVLACVTWLTKGRGSTPH